MPFPKMELRLTDEQVETLKPFQDEISRDSKKTIIAEMFVIEADHKFRTIKARLMDSIAVAAVSKALVEAQNDYDKRRAKAERIQEIYSLMKSNLAVDIEDDKLVIKRNGHEYEVRELAPTTQLTATVSAHP